VIKFTVQPFAGSALFPSRYRTGYLPMLCDDPVMYAWFLNGSCLHKIAEKSPRYPLKIDSRTTWRFPQKARCLMTAAL